MIEQVQTKEILFGTSNKHKLHEAEITFQNTSIKITHYPVDLLELQETSVERIAIYSLEQLPSEIKSIFVEDTGLYIESLNGFPGPYAAHCFKTLGNNGILKLMAGIENRNAYFESCVAYKDQNGKIYSFLAKCNGFISNEIRGELWGFDPIFIPENAELNPLHKTFSELGDEVKKKISHRALALEKMKKFITS